MRTVTVTRVQTCALPVEASAILAMDTSPQFTAMSAWAPPEPSLEVVKVAALCRLGHSVLSVGSETHTAELPPPSKVACPLVLALIDTAHPLAGPEMDHTV